MDERPPTAELLEARHDFPGPYTFKVIGPADDAFEGRIVECVQNELGLPTPPSTRVKTTAGGRHQSVTIEPRCEDAQTVLDLYAALRKLPDVLFLF